MNRRALRMRVLRLLLRVTAPWHPGVQIVRVRARPDFSGEVSQWTADEFGAREGSRDPFLVVVPPA